MTRIRTEFPHDIEVEDHVLIPMGDGVRLSARVWKPVGCAEAPVPAVVEYIPYRKGDGTLSRDAMLHPYVAGHGYASVRVDTRGSGESEGILADEYLPQELDDGCRVIEWLAEQPWCSGQVGMIGKSWGGFNGLQIAALQPPALQGIITVCSTDDRYADDVHYMGGSVLASKMLAWASTMLAANAIPPDPEVVGPRWRDMWVERLQANTPFLEKWMAHQRRDDYWKHGSVCEDFDAIRCPVYAVGGWADGYSNAVLRLLAGLSSPRKGLIGPWGHQYPESGTPGPRIGFLQECVRWWDHCLKGIDNGIMNEPMLHVWMQDSVAPDKVHDDRPGRWVAEPAWPSPGTREVDFWLGRRSLSAVPVEGAGRVVVRDSMVVGTDGGDWCPAGSPSDLPLDQRADDGRSVCFDSDPLVEDLSILGFPELRVRLSSDVPEARIAVRLCDVAPDGSSLLVTRGVLNLSHRNSHEHPEPLEPGTPYDVVVRLNAIAQTVPAGHRLRVAISTTYWPWIWPAPDNGELTVHLGSATRMSVHVRPDRDDEGDPVTFGEAEVAPPVEVITRAPGQNRRLVNRDAGTGHIEVARISNEAKYLPGIRLKKSRDRVETCSMVEGDPLSCMASSVITQRLEREGWRIRIETSSTMTADRDTFRGTNTVLAFENDLCVFEDSRPFVVRRDHC